MGSTDPKDGASDEPGLGTAEAEHREHWQESTWPEELRRSLATGMRERKRGNDALEGNAPQAMTKEPIRALVIMINIRSGPYPNIIIIYAD